MTPRRPDPRLSEQDPPLSQENSVSNAPNGASEPVQNGQNHPLDGAETPPFEGVQTPFFGPGDPAEFEPEEPGNPQDPAANQYPELHPLAGAFKATLAADPSVAKATRNTYGRISDKFLRWADSKGYQVAAMPPDAPEQFYRAEGLAANNSGRNIWSAVLRAFERWAVTNNVGMPELSYPASVAPPKRAKVAQVIEPMPLNNPVVVNPTAVPYQPIYQPQPGPPQGRLAAPSAVRPRARMGSVAAGLMPQGGSLRVMRESDGTDGTGPGKRSFIADYDETDLKGFADVHSFIREVVHPNLQPLTRARSTKYIVQAVDHLGRETGAPATISIVGGAGRLNAEEGGSNDPRGRLTELEESYKAKIKDLEQKSQAGSDKLWVAMMLDKAKDEFRTERKELLAEMREDKRDRDDEVSAPRRGRVMQDDFMVPYQPPAPRASPVAEGLAGIAEVMRAVGVGDIVKSKAEQSRGGGGMAETLALVKAMKDTFGPPPGNDAAITELRASLTRMEERNTELIKKLTESKAPTLEDELRKMEALDKIIERRGGSPDSVGQFLENAPDIIDSIGKAFLRFKGATPAEIKNASEQPAVVPAKKDVKKDVPAAITQALLTLRDAKVGEDRTIFGGVQGLIVSLFEAGEPWAGFGQQIVGDLGSSVDTYDELLSLIVRVFRTLGMREMLKADPGLARKVADTVARHFPVITKQYFDVARSLVGWEGVVAAGNVEEVVKEEEPDGEKPAEGEPEVPPGDAPASLDDGEESDETDESDDSEDE